MSSTVLGTTASASTTGTLLRMATAGSVDDGKSTLVGRLLHDSKSVLADQLDAVERDTKIAKDLKRRTVTFECLS